jgi:hypothetical protein
MIIYESSAEKRVVTEYHFPLDFYYSDEGFVYITSNNVERYFLRGFLGSFSSPDFLQHVDALNWILHHVEDHKATNINSRFLNHVLDVPF